MKNGIEQQTFQLLMKRFEDLQKGQDEIWKHINSLEMKIDQLAESMAFQKGKIYAVAGFFGVISAAIAEWLFRRIWN